MMTARLTGRGHARRMGLRSAVVGGLVLSLTVPLQAAMAAPVEPAAAGASTLLFVRDTASASALMTVPVDASTGAPTAAATAMDSSSTTAYSDLSVSPDGTRVAYVVESSTTAATGVVVRAVDGSGSPVTVASTASTFPGPEDSACVSDPTDCPVAQPAWSPDGTTVLFTRYGSDTGTDYRPGDLFTVPADGGTVTALPGGRLASHGSYLADGTGVIAADEDPDVPVRLIRITSAGARSVLSGGADAHSPSVSPDGKWVAAVRSLDVQTDVVVVLPATGGSAVTVSDAVSDLTAFVLDASPTWTSDSVRVYFDRLLVDAGGSHVTVRSASRTGSAVVGLTPAAGADEGWPAFAGGDRTAPVARMVAPTAVTILEPTVNVVWAALDPGLSGVATYDVRYRRVSTQGVFTAQTAWKTATTSTSAAFSLSGGNAYCWSVRATDNEGNVGLWSAERCTASPLDDRQLSRSGAWTAATSSSFYRSTVSSTTASSPYARTSTIKFRQVGVVTRTCSSCGSFSVYLGTRKLKTASTRSSALKSKVVVWLPYGTSVSTGAVKIVANGGGRVYVDGLVIRH